MHIPSPPPEANTVLVAATGAEAGQRVDRFLAQRLAASATGTTRSRIQQLIAAGCIVVQEPAGERVVAGAAETVRAGSLYRIALPMPVPAEPQPEVIPFTTLYEDADLIVLDKPAGLVVHPAPGHQGGTLVNALLAHCPDLPGIGGEKRPGIVHRLDKDTSGVMVAAKTDLALARLCAAFAAHDLDRAYLALCWGVPLPLHGEIAAPIGRDPRDRKRMAVVARGGKHALTRYRTQTVWHNALALLECHLATGRTHQIRVHMAQSGHPLVGDPVYLRRIPAAARLLPTGLRQDLLDFPRQALHATKLGFAHPRTGAALHFTTEPPEDMQGLLQSIANS